MGKLVTNLFWFPEWMVTCFNSEIGNYVFCWNRTVLTFSPLSKHAKCLGEKELDNSDKHSGVYVETPISACYFLVLRGILVIGQYTSLPEVLIHQGVGIAMQYSSVTRNGIRGLTTVFSRSLCFCFVFLKLFGHPVSLTP